MIWLAAIHAAFAAAQLLGSAQDAVSPQQHYEKAKREFAEHRFTEADNEVNAALHSKPNMVPALVLKARLAIFAHRPDVAKSCLITAITADPESEEAQFFLGVFYYTQNDFRLALSPLEKARSLAPKSPLPVFYLAMTHEALGDEAKALELYQQAEELSGESSQDYAAILVTHGRFLLTLGRTEESIDKDRRAIEVNPDLRDAHYELAKGLDHMGDFKNAASEAERALTLPDLGTPDSQIHFLLASLYRKLNQPDLSKAHLMMFQASPPAANR